MNLISLTIFCLFVISNSALAKFKTSEIEHHQLKFEYQSNDGSFHLPCKHNIYNSESGDWRINCEDAEGKWQKEFSVHFFIREINRERKPEQMIELLYALTDRNFARPYFSSQYLRLTQEKISPLHELSLSLGVENDYASLELRFHPQKKLNTRQSW